MLLIASLLCSTLAAAGAPTDVLELPTATLDVVEARMWDIVDELGLRDHVVDFVIVGSFAYGIARPPTDADPSDLDVIVYLRTLAPPPAKHLQGYNAFMAVARRVAPVL